MGDVDQTCRECGAEFFGAVGNGKCDACNAKPAEAGK